MKIKFIKGLPDNKTLSRLIESLSAVFEKVIEKDEFSKRIQSKNNVLVLIAEEASEIVGLKIGYEDKPKFFYSWIGGVLPSHRHKGIASELMKAQIKWCRENGFQHLETRTRVTNPPMMILNLKSGFLPRGMIEDPKYGLQLIFSKTLG